MYTIPIGVPFRRRNGHQCEVASDWARSLFLLRDSLQGKFGEILVAAPELPQTDTLIGEQQAYLIDAGNDAIRFHSLGQKNWRGRKFWRMYSSIRNQSEKLAAQSQIVHGGINNLWQPYALIGFNAAVRKNVPTVFVLDTDSIRRCNDLARNAPFHSRLKTSAYNAFYFRAARRAVSSASLSLLKGRSLHQRYGRYARNAKDFFDTSFSETDIIDNRDLHEKLRNVAAGASLRCLCLGRLVDHKGVHHAVRAVAEASRHIPITLDVIGDGPEEKNLRDLAESLDASHAVKFLGHRPYTSALLQEISAYHLLLFTSIAEDTPRAIFDGLAAGAAMIAFNTPFASQVIDECNHGRVVPASDIFAFSNALIDAHNNRQLLSSWITAAAAAAPRHTAEVWYQRRAEWTFEAYDRHHASSRTLVNV